MQKKIWLNQQSRCRIIEDSVRSPSLVNTVIPFILLLFFLCSLLLPVSDSISLFIFLPFVAFITDTDQTCFFFFFLFLYN
jgi:hypothetical protein